MVSYDGTDYASLETVVTR